MVRTNGAYRSQAGSMERPTTRETAGLVPILVPELGDNTGGVRVCSWLVQPGDAVSRGDRVVELVFPGVAVNVASPCDGTMNRIELTEGTEVRADGILGWVSQQFLDGSGSES